MIPPRISPRYLASLPPLTLTELEHALAAGEQLQWHPKFMPQSPDDTAPFVLARIEQYDDPRQILLRVAMTTQTRVAVTEAGYTPISGRPVFLHYVVPPESEPRNNDGRDQCWWCGGALRKAGGGQYDYCEACKR